MATPAEPQARIQSDIEALCRFPRGSASEGEREASQWVASRFQEIGLEPELETYHFYPEYWNVWGAHMLGALGAWLLLGRGGRRRRLLGAAATSFLAASFWGDAAARFHWLRRLFPARPSTNVLARLPNPQAQRLLVVSAHVDTAHSGFVFHPAVQNWLRRRYADGETPPMLILPFWALLSLAGASALRAIGLPRALAKPVALPGVVLSAATVGFLADIRRNPAVPGANDDASGVATVLALAQELAASPPRNLEVWFVVTGCEEGIMGGMYAFMERHHAELEGRRPFVLNLEMLGSGKPVYWEAEGLVTRFRFDPEAVSLAAEVGREPEFEGIEGITLPVTTDALVAHHHGFPAVTIVSLAADGRSPHYHWPSDTPENIDGASLEYCYRYLRRIIQRLDEKAG
jgi:acetylornithine deacetylase/succinyl-diaminopimelate desuccinylase-like protein